MEESAGEKFRACVLGYYTRSSSVEQTELWLALVATDLFRGNVVRRANLHTDVRDGPYTSFAIDNSRVARFFTWTGISLIERNLRCTVLFRCDLETREFFFTRHRVEKRNNSLERIIRIIFLLLLIRPVESCIVVSTRKITHSILKRFWNLTIKWYLSFARINVH